jgi:hypothetical protein
MFLRTLRILMPRVYFSFADSVGTGGTPDQTQPLAPPADSIVVAGEQFTADRIKRNHQQAQEANKLVQEKTALLRELAEAREKLNSSASFPNQQEPAIPTQPVSNVNIHDYKQLVEEAVERKLEAKQRDAAFVVEKKSAIDSLKSEGLLPDNFKESDPSVQAVLASIQTFLNAGITNDQGNIIEGTRSVDTYGNPVPATPELVAKAVKFYKAQLVSAGSQAMKARIGHQPAVPAATGNGTTQFSQGQDKSNIFRQSQEERLKGNMEWYRQKGSQNSGSSASAVA